MAINSPTRTIEPASFIMFYFYLTFNDLCSKFALPMVLDFRKVTHDGTVSSEMNPNQGVSRGTEEEQLIWAKVLEKAFQSRAKLFSER